MVKLKKNTIDWLFNQPDARKSITALGARNLTVIEAVYITSETQELMTSYSDMIMYNSQEADQKAIEWMKRQVELNADDNRYLYFRFKRWN